jgi:hypothetical protein
VNDNSIGGELAPGQVTRGWLGFQIPIDAGNLSLVFDPGLITTGQVIIDLP